jgi:hypothetical protein
LRFANLISSAFNTQSAVYHETSGAYVDGEWVENPSVGINIMVAAQEPTGRALEIIPEGYNANDAKTFYTQDQIKLNGRIEYKGETYKLIAVNNWFDLGDYCEGVGIRMMS